MYLKLVQLESDCCTIHIPVLVDREVRRRTAGSLPCDGEDE